MLRKLPRLENVNAVPATWRNNENQDAKSLLTAWLVLSIIVKKRLYFDAARCARSLSGQGIVKGEIGCCPTHPGQT
ncbi:hypothetical protein FA15DRAFT_675922 [Coprinopsis marcescibilis]|uniref:Uncharacterized protein n=1 Tax=Coprinopsis marcescibilis TaxID=230819 RepID=A0A5C3KCM5_COPMA|nr:hypothetical protein FA15DRAFT_675922 [Coprinopsis marcescibilis]